MKCPKCGSDMTVRDIDLPWWLDQAWECKCGVRVYLGDYEEKVKK